MSSINQPLLDETLNYLIENRSKVCEFLFSDCNIQATSDYFIHNKIEKFADVFASIINPLSSGSGIDFSSLSKELLGELDLYRSLSKIACDYLTSEYNGQYSSDIINMIVVRELFWRLYPKAVKKAIGLSNSTETVSASDFESYSSDKTKKQYWDESIKSFNIDANTYNLKDTKYLDIFLHTRHNNKKHRIQKKQLSRVEKRVRKVMIHYHISSNNRSALKYGRDEIPISFIRGVRKKYFD